MFSSYDDSRLQVAETGQPWLSYIGLCFSFLFLHITWILEVDILDLAPRLNDVMDEAGAFYLSPLPSLDCGFHSEIVSWS